jgi:hypothetical protein
MENYRYTVLHSARAYPETPDLQMVLPNNFFSIAPLLCGKKKFLISDFKPHNKIQNGQPAHGLTFIKGYSHGKEHRHLFRWYR